MPVIRVHFCQHCLCQEWSLPGPIIYYITKNPTSLAYDKMVKSCRYFFIKNPVFIVSQVTHEKEEWQYLGVTMDTTKLRYFGGTLDPAKLRFKLWITNSFGNYRIPPNNQNPLSLILPKIYRCEAEQIYFKKQIISYTEFLFLTPAVEKLYLDEVTVKSNDGSNVPLEKLFETLPKAILIRYKSDLEFPTITSKTFKELIKIPHFAELENVSLENIPQTFDLKIFSDYMKKNKHTCLRLIFEDSISEDYENKLEEFIDEIIDTEKHDYKVPCIQFSGLDEDKDLKLVSLQWETQFAFSH